ncbi:asparagine synthase (glutamine-hydrolyzing) [Gammaproteobacteria bacterium LSUCC0112]|nr:asparagine synthase (glutamine-hydrolyzing) [Gammaproteobacteria bacterium LSUCC0112]
MCGIAGFWGGSYLPINAELMADRLVSRGPDDSGYWFDELNSLGLAHRRLSILDLSPAGAQPMVSPCGNFVLVFNGEIYNHLELRKELESAFGRFIWRGHSDTETLLAGLRYWGVAVCLTKLVGMFAFALWNVSEKVLILARDRMGEKPLYYGRAGETFLFGSELKALTAHTNWDGVVDQDALALYLRFGYVPSPYSIYRGVFKLPPAHFLTVTNFGCDLEQPECYWDLSRLAKEGASQVFKPPEALIAELDELLLDAVNLQMAADVPLGVFLSGGYDSSTIASLMQAQSVQPVKTFSIGFDDLGFNEAIYAKRVAQHLGTDHSELYITANDAMSVIPKLPTIYDEPFADVSQIPTFIVSQLARTKVTVSLSGDGGDELFCGYNRYVSGYGIWKKFQWLPLPARKLLSSLIARAPTHILNAVQSHLPLSLQIPSLEEKLPKLANTLLHQDGLSYYRELVSHARDPALLLLAATEPNYLIDRGDLRVKLPGMREKMMFLDMKTYLPDDILTKIDRASMAVSLETRVPLLDHRVVEFALRLPTEYKYRNGQGKWLLRQVLYKYVPREIMDRPKMGFSVPIANWLRGPLRDWAEALLDEARLQREGFFNPKPIRNMWTEHLNNKRNWQCPLWDILMFQSWLEEWRG